MKTLYQISMSAPIQDGGGCPIQINLWPEWKDAVARYALTQDMVNKAIENLGRAWLDGCGYGTMYDPDEDPRDRWESLNLGKARKLSANARHLYEPRIAIRIIWGEWGPEHLTIPGDACGLDISDGISSPPNGISLLPHNVDSMKQAYLLLLVFTWFADAIIANELLNNP